MPRRTTQAAISEDDALWAEARLRCVAVDDDARSCFKKLSKAGDHTSRAAGDYLCNAPDGDPKDRESPFLQEIYRTGKCESITRKMITRVQADPTGKEWLDDKARKESFEEWPSEWEKSNEDVADTTACCKEKSEPKTYDMLIKASETCEAVEGACLMRVETETGRREHHMDQVPTEVSFKPIGEQLCGEESGKKGDHFTIFNDPFLQKIVEDDYSCDSITRGLIKEEIKKGVKENPKSIYNEKLHQDKHYFFANRLGAYKYHEESLWASQVEDDNTKCCKRTQTNKPKTPEPAPAASPHLERAPAPMTQAKALPKPACEVVPNACMVTRIERLEKTNAQDAMLHGHDHVDVPTKVAAGRHFCNLKVETRRFKKENPVFQAIESNDCKNIDLEMIGSMDEYYISPSNGDGMSVFFEDIMRLAKSQATPGEGTGPKESCCYSISPPKNVVAGPQPSQTPGAANTPEPQEEQLQPSAEQQQEAPRIGVLNVQCCATGTFLQEKEQPAWPALRGSRGFSSKSPEAMTSVLIAMGLVVLSFVLFALVYLFRSRWLRTGRKEKEAHGKKIADHVAYGSTSDSSSVLDASATL
ncbi:unnamed protein product [Amoebophrya sp. A25]|nr:unnamed protein product [Amoebophrya sp. A25]|eukprot:GSA25T00005507001.1